MYKYFIILLFGISFAFSQNESYKHKKNTGSSTEIFGKIYGLVKDKKTKLPLQYSTISLFELKQLNGESSSIIVEGTITNEKGYFSFDNLKIGTYIINVDFAGYNTLTLDADITAKKLNKNLKNIFLESSTYILDAVEISDQAPVYENKIEKIVYNVENDLSITANDGIDVLRNAPFVSVDIEDNVSLRGSQNVKFLLNGKTSSFLNKDNISDVLQTIPAEQIKSIEIIISPTAKYDAEGDAGIINIITKQKNIEGFSSSINTSTGTRVNRSSFNISAGKNRFGISGSGGARYGWPRDGNTSFSTLSYDNMDNLLMEQTKAGKFVGNWIGFRGSMDIYYDINAYSSITSNLHIGGHNNSNEGVEDVTLQFLNNPIELYSVSDTSSNNDTEYEATISYIQKFPNREGQELSIGLQYGGHIHDDDKIIHQIGYEDNIIDNTNDGTGNEITFQIDYIHPFGDENKIEIGIKNIQRYMISDYNTTLSDEIDSTWLNNNALSNIFDYNQRVSAAYVSTQFNFPKDFGVLMGLRYEHTGIEGFYEHSHDSFSNSYQNIVPSMILSKKLNMFKTIKLSYSNRIQRPDVHHTNTNISIDDLNNITIGNPELIPSKTHQVELGYTSFKPGLMTSFSLFYKGRYDVVEAFTSLIEDNIFETTYKNTGDNHSFGFNFYGSTTIKEFLTLRGSLDVYTYNMSTLIDSANLSRTSLNYNYMINANFALGKGYTFESRAFLHSPRQTIQGERPSFSMISFGFKREFSNKKGSIGIGIIEPFSKYKSFDTTIEGVDSEGNTFETMNGYEILFRSFNISFKYRFGKVDFDPIKKKSSIKNDDLLEEDGGDY